MFCPECGSTETPMIERICQDCFLKKFSILEIPESIEVTICAHCSAKFREGKWEESEISEEEIIFRTLEQIIIVDSQIDDDNLKIELEIIQMRGTIAECHIEAKGKIFEQNIHQSFNTKVRLIKNVCPNCSKRQSGYYESVIQFRTDARELIHAEKEKADEIVMKILNRRFDRDKLAYLAQKLKLKEGNDYYIGSYKSGKKIVEAIQEEFGGIIKESPKLISKNKSTGKGLYRIWILIRLPKFKKGDFIRYDNKYHEIIAIDGKRILIKELTTLEKIPLKWKEYASIDYLKSYEDIQTTTIISISPSIIQILDPDNYSVVDIKMKKSFEKFNINDEIKVIKIGDNIYPVLNKCKK